MAPAEPEPVLFVLSDRDLRPFASPVDASRMRCMIGLLLWSAAAIVGICGAAFLGAKLLPFYLVHK